MDFQRTTLEGYQLTVDTVFSQEETTESIVPDSFPDISRIISASGTAYLSAKQLNRGMLKMMGAAHICVMYMPENDANPRALWLKLPFQCTGEDPKVKESDCFHVSVLSVSADARILNPRKLFVKAEIKFGVKVYTQFKNEVIVDITAAETESIQKKLCEVQQNTIAAVVEKPFLFSDTLRCSQSKPQAEELLHYRIDPAAAEARYIGNKLVCKGEMNLITIYRTGNELNTARFELPFSQILDLESAVSEGSPEVTVYLKNVECTLRGGEIDISVEAALQARLWTSGTVSLLNDIYSTAVPLIVDRSTSEFCISRELEAHRETAKKFCESGIPAKQVLDCHVSLAPHILQRDGAALECRSEAAVSILYLSEDDALCSAEYTIPIRTALKEAEDIQCKCACRPVGEAVAVPVTGGFEVRAEIEFIWEVTRIKSSQFVSKAEQSNDVDEMTQGPSVIVRMVGAGETLWDIAKSCRSTISDICMANQLTAERAEPGAILLIPTKR